MKSNKGFTGVDIAVSVVILIIFVSVIGSMFYNLSVTERRIQRKTEATNTAIRTIEAMKAIPFDQLAEGMTLEDINNLSTNKIEVPNGYTVTVGVDNTTYKDIVKIISVNVDYQNGKETENVNIETLVRNLSIVEEEIKGIFVALNGTDLGFFDTEQEEREYADSDSHYFGNIGGQHYSNTNQRPWYSVRNNINSVTFFDKITPTSTAFWFEGFKNLTSFNNMTNLDTSQSTSMTNMFARCLKLTSIDVSTFDTGQVTNMIGMFSGDSNTGEYMSLTEIKGLENFNTSNVTSMWDMFLNCGNLSEINVSNFDTSKVTNMQGMFYGCKKLQKIDLKKFKTKNVTNMWAMFYCCFSLTVIDVSNFDTSNVTTMGDMFAGNHETGEKMQLKQIIGLENFNTSNVTIMWDMFLNCSNLTSLNLSSFNTSKVENFQGMFYNCSGLTTLDLRYFNTQKANNMTSMFFECTNLKTIYVGSGWSTSQANTTGMFHNCGTSSVTHI